MLADPSPHPDSSNSCSLGGAGMSYVLNSPFLGLYEIMRALWLLSTFHTMPCGSTALPLILDGSFPGGGATWVYFRVFGSMRPMRPTPPLMPLSVCSFSPCSLIHAIPCESTEMSCGAAPGRRLNSTAVYLASGPLSNVLDKWLLGSAAGRASRR